MNSLFALVITVCTVSGDCSEVVTGVYESEKECYDVSLEEQSGGSCYPVEAIIPADDQRPAVRF